MSNEPQTFRIGRRAFLQQGTLILTSGLLSSGRAFASDTKTLKIGLVTDLHYADKPPGGTRHYRETLHKLAEAAGQFEREQLDFVVELGDLIDAADSVETEKRYLTTINREFSALSRDRHYVLGNHCVDTLRKEEFLAAVGQEKSWYSFDRAGFHFVVLDSCYRSDGVPYGRKNFEWTDANIPPEELDWLKQDLAETDCPVIVFAHQRLDVRNSHGVKNNEAVRTILESSGNVIAAFQGHSHKNDLKDINGIHYCTLVAMVEGSGEENNSYSVMELSSDGTIQLKGFRQQQDYNWPGKR